MEPMRNAGVDLLSAALDESGLGDLSGFDFADFLEEPPQQTQQVTLNQNGQLQQIGAVTLAQSTPTRPSQYITVQTDGAGQNLAQIMNPHAAQTPVKTQIGQPQAARTPLTAKIIGTPNRANTPTISRQLVLQGMPQGGGTNRIVFTQPANLNSNGTAVVRSLVSTPGRTGATPQNVQNIVVTTQCAKTGVQKKILVAQNGHGIPQNLVRTVGGQVVQARVGPGPQQVRIRSPQIVQGPNGLTKMMLNGQPVRLGQGQHFISTANGQKLRITSPSIQTRAVTSPMMGLPRHVFQAIPSSSASDRPRVGQPSVITVVTSKGQAGLAGMKVNAASASGQVIRRIQHSASLPPLGMESSPSSRSNSPVCGLDNIPTVVPHKMKKYIGVTGSLEEMNWAAFKRSSTTLRVDIFAKYTAAEQQSILDRLSEYQRISLLEKVGKKHPHTPSINGLQTEEAEEDTEELGHAETYVAEYKPMKVEFGKKHPDQVVESSSLSSVEPPDVIFHLEIIRTSERLALSSVQLEAILYACQRHEIILPCSERAGYLIGDGAGVGKGRTVAGIINENFLRGRKRALWLSVSNDLRVDAERDLEDIGSKIKVYPLNKFKYSAKITSTENGNVKKGVIFITYSSLIGESTQSASKYSSRMNQLLRWCGPSFDGPIIFDECHKAKNLYTSGSKGSSTKTSLAVMELQRSLPNARIVYASATGATEPRNMAYMARLGIWGVGTPFCDFNDFITCMEKRGVGAMELVAIDMKLRGMYIARQLSFKGVTFRIEEIPVESRIKRVYDRSVEVWMEARSMFQLAADLIKADHRLRKTMWGQFWSAHQRFFKYLCISAKVPHCVNLVREAVKSNKCVVIGLQSTGEARTQEMVEMEGGDLNDFVSTAKGVFQTLVEKHFPAADRRKTLGLLGSLGRNDGYGLDAASLKRKRHELVGMKKQAKMDSSDEDDDMKSDSSCVSDFSDSDSDSDSDEDTNPFANGADSDDDMPWVKKRKTNKKGKQKKKKPKKKKKKKSSDEDQDDYCDSTLARMLQMKKSCSLASTANTNVDADPDNQNGMAMAQRMKEELLKQIEMLGVELPPNTLDHLIDELGGPDMVAEMTGRKGRVVQNDDGIQYETRSEVDVPLEMLNLKEKDRFMKGEKDIAIISEAASSGISLQADRRVANQKRRVHITLELPWSADRAIQQFGRTHRSNQVSAPEYVFMISDLAGERRFASTVAKRLESLGALTHGDRRATESRDLSQFNIDNRFGRSALEVVLKSVVGLGDTAADPPANYPWNKFKEDVKKALEGVGLIHNDKYGMAILEKEYNNISKFLNRLLGMPCDLQNALFEYFNNTLNAVILDAKKCGKWDMGIMDLGSTTSETVTRLETQSFWGNTVMDSAKTNLATFQVERGLRWEDALNIWRKCKTPEEGFYLNAQDRNPKKTAILVVFQRQNKKREKVYGLYRPNIGLQFKSDTLEGIKKKFRKVLPDAAEKWWTAQYDGSATLCYHGYWNVPCKKSALGLYCDVGRRTRLYHVLSGSVLSVWKVVDTTLNSIHSASNCKMQLMRITTVDGQKVVGSLIPPSAVKPLASMLKDYCKHNDVEKHHQSLQDAVNGLAGSTLPSTARPTPSTSTTSSSSSSTSTSTSLLNGMPTNSSQHKEDTNGESSSDQFGAPTAQPPSTPVEPLLSMPVFF